jgi:DNA-binding IscR family transcriptional regulator
LLDKFSPREVAYPTSVLTPTTYKLFKRGYSTRGRNGGLVFSKKISDIFIVDIIESVEDLDSINKCILGFTDCPFDDHCSMHEFWRI